MALASKPGFWSHATTPTPSVNSAMPNVPDANPTKPPLFTFAVIADSHFHLDGHDPQSAYPSDALHNDRNQVVVETINRANPAFVMHLGDVPHPVPGVEAHRGALAVAQRTYDAFKAPLTVVPGNHDVGDKPQGWATAPGANASRHQVFSEHWGAPFGSFDEGPCHMVWIDSPILNSGLPLEAKQEEWLIADLEQASAQGQRIFVFIHYPPYLCEDDEPEHYDNLAEPGRRWLLDLLETHRVEALFCGHVHHFFWNRHTHTDIYILPATSFVRPEYSELCSVGPTLENGRDDRDKLGFFFVHIHEEGHTIEPVRTGGDTASSPPPHPALLPGCCPPTRSPLGATLRHDWTRPRGLPCANLDEFRRKLARNDLPLQALWETGIEHLRIPAGDIAIESTWRRWTELCDRGGQITVFSAGSAALEHAPLIAQNARYIASWEVITLKGETPNDPRIQKVREAGVPILVSVVGGVKPSQGTEEDKGKNYFSHFPPHGYAHDSPALARPFDPELADGFVGCIRGEVPVWEAALALADHASRLDCQVIAHVEVPRNTEGERQTDDLRVATCVVEARLASQAHPHLTLLLDTFVDHDRGYYPRNGLLDRRGTARPALHALRHLEQLLPTTRPSRQTTPAGDVYTLGADLLWIATADPTVRPPGFDDRECIDLITGASLAPSALPPQPGLYYLRVPRPSAPSD